MQPDATGPEGALTGAALHAAKRALRTTMIAARDALDPAVRAAASHTIGEQLKALPSFVTARVVLVTFPFGSEWDSRPFACTVLSSGKTLVAPRVNNATRMLELHAVDDIAHQITAGFRGIPEPLSSLPRFDATHIDWVLVPGVAFSVDGRRLGYGGGFYDRLMATLAKATPCIAGAFDAQIAANIPAAAHDLYVDRIITESRTYPASKG